MNSILGIINLNEDESMIKEITYHRPIAAIPFAGRYRIIDFTISSMVNSDINHVYIFTRNKYRSITDHIKSGRDWDLERKNKGVLILNPLQNFYSSVRRSDMDIISDYIDYIYYSKEKYIVITPSYFVSNINYREMLDAHKESKADISVAYKKMDNPSQEFLNSDTLVLDSDARVIDIIRKKNPCNVFMETIMMERKLFIDIINKRILGADRDLFIDEVFQLKNNLKIQAYQYQGYLAKVNSIRSYYKRNMELLEEDYRASLFDESWPVYTKSKDEPPAKYGDAAITENSLISSGCDINGEVSNSVLFRRVKVFSGAKVENSIMMQNSTLEEDAYIENVILDKNAIVSKGKIIVGTVEKPIIIEKNQVI